MRLLVSFFVLGLFSFTGWTKDEDHIVIKEYVYKNSAKDVMQIKDFKKQGQMALIVAQYLKTEALFHKRSTTLKWYLRERYDKAGEYGFQNVNIDFGVAENDVNTIVAMIFPEAKDTSKLHISAYSDDFLKAKQYSQAMFEKVMKDFHFSGLKFRARAVYPDKE